ncbi:ABC transporter permease [Microbacterium sp. A93]|uniref:ABC transporter permease n=1 Tax=Microbacterium sp. A93 TaxID=3450716 RepID=UPI003F43E22E
MRTATSPFIRIIGTLTAIILIGPALVVIPLSFTDRDSFQFPPSGWSLNYYERLFTEPVWVQSIGLSLMLAIVVAICTTVLGTLAALGISRLSGKIASSVRVVLMVPLVVPGIVAAVAIYQSFLSAGIDGTFGGFILAHTALALPIAMVTVTSALQDVGPNQELASQSLGAGPVATFMSVTLPQIRGGVIGGALFAFVTSFDEVVVSLFIQSPSFRTLPVQMYSSVTTEADPTIAAASTVVLVLTTALIATAFRTGKVQTPYE